MKQKQARPVMCRVRIPTWLYASIRRSWSAMFFILCRNQRSIFVSSYSWSTVYPALKAEASTKMRLSVGVCSSWKRRWRRVRPYVGIT